MSNKISRLEQDISKFAAAAYDDSFDIYDKTKLLSYATDSLENLGNETFAGIYNQNVYWQYFYMFLNAFEAYCTAKAQS